MIDTSPVAPHMTMEIFEASVKFCNGMNAKTILISGGEPLENPLFFDMVGLVKGRFFVAVLSNGMFLEDELLTKKVIALGVPIQITNDPSYYPKRINYRTNPLIGYESRIQTMVSLGRAKQNNFKTNRKGPACFNLRSLVNKFHSLKEAIQYQEVELHKFCTPTINQDGSISAGETTYCQKIGNVYFSNEQLTKNLREGICDECGLVESLPTKYKQAIGRPD